MEWVSTSDCILKAIGAKISFNEMVKNKCCFGSKAMIQELKTAKRGDHLMVLNYPLLTRVTAGVLMIFSQCFEEVGFIRPSGSSSGILFCEFKGGDYISDQPKIVQGLEKICQEVEGSTTDDLLEVLPVHILCQEPFYSTVVAFNAINLRELCSSMLETVKSKLEKE